jgi:hypothetical protein
VAGLLRLEAEYVSCFGSGTIREELVKHYNSPFAVESAHIKFRDSDLSACVYRSLFDTARQYRESFEVYGSEKSFEWPLVEGEDPIIHTAKKPEHEIPARVKVPDYAHRLPEPIQCSRPAACTTSRRTSTCRSCKAAATVVRTRTWPTSS